MRQINKGFSLVELLVAVAIVGVLAAIAVPQYGAYVKRAKISEAVDLTLEIKTAMIQSYHKTRKFPANSRNLSARNKSIGLQDTESYETEYISAMWIGSDGVVGSSKSGHIAIVLDRGLKAGLNGGSNAMLLSTIEADGRGGFEFICGNTSSAWKTTVHPDLLPASCRN